jgi:NADH-quinone oxidoreductase subunit M
MMLWLLILMPLIGAGAICFAKASAAKWIAMVVTVAALAWNIVLAFGFSQWGSAGYGLESHTTWLAPLGITLDVGVDAVAMLLVMLTTLLMPLCVWGSFTAITTRRREYYAWLLVLASAMTGVFIARDLLLFYTCFELTLVPMYFLIAIYGGSNRAHASTKFFIYTFTGSVITLAGLVYVLWRFQQAIGMWTFDIEAVVAFASSSLTVTEQSWVLLALLAGFAVKIPLFPVHTWLPLAHTEAPTAGSVVLAGVLLKLGTYGIYLFVLPMVPLAVVLWAPTIGVLAVIGVLYAALICWVQDDVKKLIAYSSVSHLGFCVLGLFALNPLGLQGAVLYMINHGLSTGALFFLIGMMYERYHTRDMNAIGGLMKVMPVWAFFMVFFVLASVGLPGLNGFVSEFYCLLGTFVAGDAPLAYPGVLGPWFAVIAALGMVFAAMYLLIMVGKIVFGPLRVPSAGEEHDHHRLPADLSWREIGILVPLAVLCVYLGVQSTTVTDALEGSIERTLVKYPGAVRNVDHLRVSGGGSEDDAASWEVTDG